MPLLLFLLGAFILLDPAWAWAEDGRSSSGFRSSPLTDAGKDTTNSSGKRKPRFATVRKKSISQPVLSPADASRLITAIEDFRFGDYDVAIPVLRELNGKYPHHHDILSTLARALDESGRTAEAIPFFTAWHRAFPHDRNAVIGLNGAFSKTGRFAEGAEVMAAWLRTHKEDVQAMTLYAGGQLRAGNYKKVKAMSRKILQAPNADPVERAAAHYYLAYAALAAGDLENANQEVAAVIQEAPKGRYAGLARQLREQIQAQSGKQMSVSVAAFRSSNFSLLPTNLLDVPVDRTQTLKGLGIQTDIGLNMHHKSLSVNYALNYTWYDQRPDLDLLYQRFSPGLARGRWVFSPYYEYAQLGQDFLFHGTGMSAMWVPRQNWMVLYMGGYKWFSSTYTTNGKSFSSLKRLNAASHDLTIQKTWKIKHHELSLAATGHLELTKGDATHFKSDSYRQAGLRGGWRRHEGKWEFSASFDSYLRYYRKPDTTILNAGFTDSRRWDRYVKLNGSIDFKPPGSHSPSFGAFAQWQSNRSNYRAPVVSSSKIFIEWRFGGTVKWVY